MAPLHDHQAATRAKEFLEGLGKAACEALLHVWPAGQGGEETGELGET
jgi:hypothetical protein